jgi:hypothetical protein
MARRYRPPGINSRNSRCSRHTAWVRHPTSSLRRSDSNLIATVSSSSFTTRRCRLGARRPCEQRSKWGVVPSRDGGGAVVRTFRHVKRLSTKPTGLGRGCEATYGQGPGSDRAPIAAHQAIRAASIHSSVDEQRCWTRLPLDAAQRKLPPRLLVLSYSCGISPLGVRDGALRSMSCKPPLCARAGRHGPVNMQWVDHVLTRHSSPVVLRVGIHERR